MSQTSELETSVLVGRVRRLLRRPWIMTHHTQVLGTLQGLLFRTLTAKGLILNRVRRDGSVSPRGVALSLEHWDTNEHLLGQAYLEAREVEVLVGMLDLEQHAIHARDVPPELSAIEVLTRDGLAFGWYREGAGWALAMKLRNETAFSLPVKRAGDLREFLKSAVQRMEEIRDTKNGGSEGGLVASP